METETRDAESHRFLVLRVVVHVLVSLMMFVVLVGLGWAPWLALGIVLAGGAIAFVLQL